MPATTDTETVSRTIAFRGPPRIERELEALAKREGNPISATVRRLVSLGLDNERRSSEGGAMTPWLTAAEAAAYLKRGMRFVLREIHAGRLPAARIGGRGEILTRAD